MRLIDADALEDKFGCSDADILAKEEIRDAPTIDAVPVVHCGDCKHWKKITSVNGYCTCAVGLQEADLSDCFCSYGERKDGGADNDNVPDLVNWKTAPQTTANQYIVEHYGGGQND